MIASVAYALTAQDANTLGGRTPESFANATHTHGGGDITSAVAKAVDADTVDGKHAAEFAASSHTHSGTDITSTVANADTVDNIHASTTPTANRLLALDGTGKFPGSVLKTFDSGWFPVNPSTRTTFTHNFGTEKIIAELYFNTSPSMSGAVRLNFHADADNQRGGNIFNVTSTQLTVQATRNWPGYLINDDGGERQIQSGYYRVLALALE